MTQAITAENSPTKFNSDLPWTIDVLWQGLSGVHQIDDVRRAVLTLSIYGHGDHYEGYTVEIISKTSGPITKRFFNFDDYLPRDERADPQRTDYPHGDNRCFEVVSYCGWKWYIAEPAHPEKFTEAIEQWLDEWR